MWLIKYLTNQQRENWETTWASACLFQQHHRLASCLFTHIHTKLKFLCQIQKMHKVALISLLFVDLLFARLVKTTTHEKKKKFLPPCMLHRVNSNCSFSHSVKIILFVLSLNLLVQSRRESLCALYFVPLNTRIGRSATRVLGCSQMIFPVLQEALQKVMLPSFNVTSLVGHWWSVKAHPWRNAPFSSLICYPIFTTAIWPSVPPEDML